MNTQNKKEEVNTRGNALFEAGVEFVERNGEKFAVREDGVASYVDLAGAAVSVAFFGLCALGFVAGAVLAVFR